MTLQRALLICLVALIALLPLWIAMEPVLLALGGCTPLHMQNVAFSSSLLECDGCALLLPAFRGVVAV